MSEWTIRPAHIVGYVNILCADENRFICTATPEDAQKIITAQVADAEREALRGALESIYEHCLYRATHIKGDVGDELEEVANMATAALAALAPSTARGEGAGEEEG